MSSQTFRAVLTKSGSKAILVLPFDPNEVWGKCERHHLTGSVKGCRIRSAVDVKDGVYSISLGAVWRESCELNFGDEVTVVLLPEGPQPGNLAADVAAALTDLPEVQSFFLSLPTFYRKNFIRWIEDAKRPETRAKRINEMVELLKAGKRER